MEHGAWSRERGEEKEVSRLRRDYGVPGRSEVGGREGRRGSRLIATQNSSSCRGFRAGRGSRPPVRVS
jgi:hypothetical protein